MPASSLMADPARLVLSIQEEALSMFGRPGVRSPSSPSQCSPTQGAQEEILNLLSLQPFSNCFPVFFNPLPPLVCFCLENSQDNTGKFWGAQCPG